MTNATSEAREMRLVGKDEIVWCGACGLPAHEDDCKRCGCCHQEFTITAALRAKDQRIAELEARIKELDPYGRGVVKQSVEF